MFKNSAKPLYVDVLLTVLSILSVLNSENKICINKAGVQGIHKHSWILPGHSTPFPCEGIKPHKLVSY